MGTLPPLSILKGPQVSLTDGFEPIPLHRIFETTVAATEKISQNNNNEIKLIHSVSVVWRIMFYVYKILKKVLTFIYSIF